MQTLQNSASSQPGDVQFRSWITATSGRCLQRYEVKTLLFTAEALFKDFTCLRLISQNEFQLMSLLDEKKSPQLKLFVEMNTSRNAAA